VPGIAPSVTEALKIPETSLPMLVRSMLTVEAWNPPEGALTSPAAAKVCAGEEEYRPGTTGPTVEMTWSAR
jgi:hypothetical protein